MALRRLRVRAGLTQEQLAESAGLSPRAIRALERGERQHPYPHTVRALAGVLGLTDDESAGFAAAAARRHLQQGAHAKGHTAFFSVATHAPPPHASLPAASLIAPVGATASAAPHPPPALTQTQVVPRELPRLPADFTGRAHELTALRQVLDRAPHGPGDVDGARTAVVSAIHGMAGIGKSALAICAAHRLAQDQVFPDGQIYVNLHGSSSGLAPLEPIDALRHLLGSLGLEPTEIPTETEQAAARFRSLAAERRLLVLLDNARSPEQVRPLLPGSSSCGVLITSRSVLATLEGSSTIRLDALPHEEAVELLGRTAGMERVAAEPQAAAEVVRWCGHLPLAIRIAGARLVARARWPIHELARHLADASRRLELLQAGELAVRASFDVSLRSLEESQDPIDRLAVSGGAIWCCVGVIR